jgi:hypothetical protein
MRNILRYVYALFYNMIIVICVFALFNRLENRFQYITCALLVLIYVNARITGIGTTYLTLMSMSELLSEITAIKTLTGDHTPPKTEVLSEHLKQRQSPLTFINYATLSIISLIAAYNILFHAILSSNEF